MSAEADMVPQPGRNEAGEGALRVRDFSPSDRDRWDAFVDACQSATFFHRCGWRDVIQQAFRHKPRYMYAERNGRIEGILPLVHLRSLLFGNALISTPFCVYGGIAAATEEAHSALAEAARTLAEDLRVDYLEYRNRERRDSDMVSKDLYVTFRKPLFADPDANMQAIPRKQRAMVRKGIKAGLRSEVDDGVDRFYAAYAESVRNLGTPVFGIRYFRLLKEAFGDRCDILTITKDGRLISSVLSFYFRDEVLPYYGGGVQEARQVKGNDFMYWELMRRSAERGVRAFDFGRSKVDSGSYGFKKNWGFEPEALHYQYHLVRAGELPDVSPRNPKYRLFIAAWKRLPVQVSKLLGPMVARNLG